MAGNENHRCKKSQRHHHHHHLFECLLSRTIDNKPNLSPRHIQLITLLLCSLLAFQNLPQISASSQQSPNGISEKPRSHQDNDNNHHHYEGDAAAQEDRIQAAPGFRLVDKRDTGVGESEVNNNNPSPDVLEDSEGSSSDGPSSNEDIGNDYSSPSSTSSTTDDYKATSSSSTLADESDTIDIDGPLSDASTGLNNGANNGGQMNAPRRRTEAMMDLARNPQPINPPSTPKPTNTVTLGSINHQTMLNRQRQAQAIMPMQQMPPTNVAGAAPQAQIRREQLAPASQQVAGTTMPSMARGLQRSSAGQAGAQAQLMPINGGGGGTMRDPRQHNQPAQQLQPANAAAAHQHHQQHHQFTTTTASTNRPQTSEIPMATFNLNMGADRMLIKPHDNRRAETMAPPTSTRTNIMNQQEMATESVNHELLMSQPVPINDRRPPSDLLYQSSSGSLGGRAVMLDRENGIVADSGGGGGNSFAMRHSIESSFASRAPQSFGADQEQLDMATQVSVPSICYTPLALIMVIVVTMMITILVCFCTHVLIRHLGRHRFDLIESSRQLNTKYGCGQVEGAAGGRPPMLAPPETGSALTCAEQGDNGNNKSHSFMLNLFQNDQSLQQQQQQNNEFDRNGKTLQRLCDEHGFAFDNPYFRDDTGRVSDRHAAYLRHQHQQQQQDQLEKQRQQAQNEVNQPVGLLTTQNDQLMQGTDTAREQLHFIEHHISNLHNKQVTSSVKELSILGSPNATHVVDLTSEEQRAKVIADPKEGDLVSVDITGHDIIGLGFDVYGDQQEGIFIKSVQTRGPARESGCIQPGDRIKCLNISFENMTLQDACDILNCGSPYRMRLLLEKRFAPTINSSTKSDHTKLAANHMRAPTVQDQAIMFRQNLPPKMIRRPLVSTTNFNQRQPERAMTVSTGNGGRFIEATRHCVKRLTSLISGGPPPRSANGTDALEPYRDQFNTGYRVSSERQMFEPMHHLGSAAARRQQFALAVNVNHLNGSHLNHGAAAQKLDCGTNGHRRQSSGDEVGLNREFSGLSPMNNNGSRSTNCADRSPTNSISSNQRDRFSMDDNNSTSNDFVLDGSLDQFNNKNVNHRLHGPPLFSGARQQQVGGKREAVDLHLATNEPINPLSDSKQVNSANGIGPRRQSAADVVGQFKEAALKRQTKLQHLEQTQSQPEIAHNGDDDLQDDNRSIAARSDADCNSVDLQTFAKGRPLDLSSGQPLVGSVSTPTMNLFSTTTAATTTTNATNITDAINATNKRNNSAADWQQISSRRNKKDQLQKQKKENSIREEPISDSSFGADSTSKLVQAEMEEIDKNSELTINDESTDSAMATETTQFPSSTISSKNSTDDLPVTRCQFGSMMFPPYAGFSPYGGLLGGAQPPARNPFITPNIPFLPWSRPSANPYSGPSIPSNNQYNPYVARPASPARQCRTNGICRELDHGTTLATSWRLRTTTPIPRAKFQPKITTPTPINRADVSSLANDINSERSTLAPTTGNQNSTEITDRNMMSTVNTPAS